MGAVQLPYTMIFQYKSVPWFRQHRADNPTRRRSDHSNHGSLSCRRRNYPLHSRISVSRSRLGTVIVSTHQGGAYSIRKSTVFFVWSHEGKLSFTDNWMGHTNLLSLRYHTGNGMQTARFCLCQVACRAMRVAYRAQ